MVKIGDSPASFEQLRLAVEALIKPEMERIRRFNDKMRDRGQEVDEEREAAETDQSWLSDFVRSPLASSLWKALTPRLRAFKMCPKEALSSIVGRVSLSNSPG
jgi:Iap family predicted aminopeptidase